MAICSPIKLSNLVRYVHNMMGNFTQESCDQSRGGGGVNKMIILYHKGKGGGPGWVQHWSQDIWTAPETLGVEIGVTLVRGLWYKCYNGYFILRICFSYHILKVLQIYSYLGYLKKSIIIRIIWSTTGVLDQLQIWSTPEVLEHLIVWDVFPDEPKWMWLKWRFFWYPWHWKCDY